MGGRMLDIGLQCVAVCTGVSTQDRVGKRRSFVNKAMNFRVLYMHIISIYTFHIGPTVLVTQQACLYIAEAYSMFVPFFTGGAGPSTLTWDNLFLVVTPLPVLFPFFYSFRTFISFRSISKIYLMISAPRKQNVVQSSVIIEKKTVIRTQHTHTFNYTLYPVMAYRILQPVRVSDGQCAHVEVICPSCSATAAGSCCFVLLNLLVMLDLGVDCGSEGLTLKPFVAEVHLNCIQRFSSYRKGKTTRLRYKDQLVDAV